MSSKTVLLPLSLIIMYSCASCSSDTSSLSSSDTTGTWIAKKVVSYNNGKETISFQQEEGEGGFAGSKGNPAILRFTKYGELLFGKGEGLKVYQYKIEGDSLKLGKFGAFHISKIGRDTLSTAIEIKINYYDNSIPHGKSILTFYYTR